MCFACSKFLYYSGRHYKHFKITTASLCSKNGRPLSVPVAQQSMCCKETQNYLRSLLLLQPFFTYEYPLLSVPFFEKICLSPKCVPSILGSRYCPLCSVFCQFHAVLVVIASYYLEVRDCNAPGFLLFCCCCCCHCCSGWLWIQGLLFPHKFQEGFFYFHEECLVFQQRLH